jgi:hypothetical protein
MIRGALAIAAVLALAAPARAQPSLPPSVELVLPDCPIVSFEPMMDLLRLELAEDGVSELIVVREAGDQAIAVVRIECTEDENVRVRIDDRATQKSVERVVSLRDVPDASRARTLALAIGELMRASWAELALIDVDVAPEVRERVLARWMARGASLASPNGPALVREEPPPPRAHRTWLAIALELAAFPTGSVALLGPCAELGIPLLPELALRFGASFGYAAAAHDLGAIEVLAAAGRVEIDWTIDLGAALLEAGPRVSLGWARSSGDAIAPAIDGSGDVPLLAISLALSCRAPIDEVIALHLGIDVGWTLLGIRAIAAGRHALGLHGAFLGVRAGLAFAL